MNDKVIDIPNAQNAFAGILTGGQPTPDQLEKARQAGYRTLVNLRAEGEQSEWNEADKARELGFDYVNIPVAGAAGLGEDNVRAFAEVINNPEARPMLIHCGVGARVGALFALKAAWIDGEERERAIDIGRETGLGGLEEPVRARL